jgi:hypothetical protein
MLRGLKSVLHAVMADAARAKQDTTSQRSFVERQ